MKAVILCAGRGSRTGLSYPKCLYRFKNKPSLLEINIEILRKQDLNLQTLNCNRF